MLESVAVAQWRKKNVINIPFLDYSWGSSTAAVSSTGKVRPKVLLQGHVGKYCDSLLVPAQESLIPTINKPKEPKENIPSSRNLVLLSSPLSNAGVQLFDASFKKPFSILAVIVAGKGLALVSCTTVPPLWHPCCDSGAREEVTVLLATLFKFWICIPLLEVSVQIWYYCLHLFSLFILTFSRITVILVGASDKEE